MNLVRAELRRLFKRRITRYMLLLLVVAYAVIAVGFSLSSEKIGPQQRAAAQVQADEQHRQATRQAERDRADCERAREAGVPDDRFPAEMPCDQIGPPPEGTFQAEWYLPYEFDFRDEYGRFIAVFAAVFALFAFVVGASYVGAEWSTGGMMNLLLWRPKRLTVLSTKLGVLIGGLLSLWLVIGGLWTGAFWLIGKYDGQLGKLTEGAWRSFALDGARGLGLVLAVGIVAFGLASAGRHTGMALGVAVGLGVISEIGMRIVVGILDVPFGDRYVLSTYVVSWFFKEYELTDWTSCHYVQGGCEPETLLVTWQESAVLFGVGTAVVLVAAGWLMRRRDIT